MNNTIKAYGDFNSDLRSDYVAMDSSNNTLIFIFSSDNVYQLAYNFSIYQNCNPINYYLCKSFLIQLTSMEMEAWISQCGARME